MPIQRSALVKGPCKIVRGAQTMFSKGDVEIKLIHDEVDVSSSAHGRAIDAVRTSRRVEVTFTPVSDWSYRTTLFPYLNPTIGDRIFGDADTALVITGKNASTDNVFTVLASAVTQMPNLFLGVTDTLFGPVTFTGVVGNNMDFDDDDSLFTVGDASYTDTTFDPANLAQQRYTAAWGAVAGFTSIYAQSGFTVESQLQLEDVKVDGALMDMSIVGVNFSARCTPVGPSIDQIHTQSRVGGTGNDLGQRLSTNAADLVITGTGVTATLEQAALVSSGYVFGDAPLRNGEIGFKTTRQVSSGTPGALLTLGT